jgi:polyphosphate kinase
MRRAERDPGELFFNRELSWLDFNSRVLEEARNPEHPLLERLKFLAIFSNNLDEFFMIHVPGIRDRSLEETGAVTERGLSSALQAIQDKLLPTLSAAFRCYQDLMAQLSCHDVRIVPYAELHGAHKERLRQYFEEEVFPILTPLAVDPGHPFPYISNLSLSLAVLIRDRETGKDHFARVKVPGRPTLPRLVPILGQRWHFVLLEEVLAAHLDRLFPGMEVIASYPFRVTRDADLELADQTTEDLLALIEDELSKRRLGEAVRLECSNRMPQNVVHMLMEELNVSEEETYRVEGPLNLADLFPITTLDLPELKDKPFVPAIPPRLRGAQDIFSVIRQSDVLLYHPFQSFGCVTDFLRKAADDPHVLTIKHTLYRTSGDSPVLEALIDAADAGKQVACLVELKARFDEANNINWAKQLEKAGVHVVYGLIGLKTHCKVTLVVRREDDGLRRYMHVGTGNYNPKTAAVYTDVGLLTCSPDFGPDASALFNYLTGIAREESYRKFLVAPVSLRKRLLAMIQRESKLHSAENPGRIIAKMNALVDPELIRALYAASAKGVRVDLIIRGMCCLRPGVPHLSENIRVISIVGRFLEHSRIFYFRNGGEDEIYIGSADWMPRNLDRRVEVVVPIEDPAHLRTLRDDVLETCLKDDCQAWELQADGGYVRLHPPPGKPGFSSQLVLLDRMAK